jgi:beta-lactamase class A
MTGWMTRRTALLGLMSLSGLPVLAHENGLIPKVSFEAIEVSLRGRLGVYVLDTETGRSSGWGEDDLVPLNSTFKLLLSGIVLKRADAGIESLDRREPVEASDLVSWSPVLERRVGQTMSIEELCRATMTQSDNAAANLLLRTMGGPHGLTMALREIGDATTRVDRFETELNDVTPGDERDTTTPFQMVRNLDALLRGDLLSAPSRSMLLSWMVENRTGDDRIRAGTPSGWIAGDRTGTGRNGETSTVAAIYPPERQPLIMAVYLRGSPLSPVEQSELHAELARIATANVMLPPFDP